MILNDGTIIYIPKNESNKLILNSCFNFGDDGDINHIIEIDTPVFMEMI